MALARKPSYIASWCKVARSVFLVLRPMRRIFRTNQGAELPSQL